MKRLIILTICAFVLAGPISVCAASGSVEGTVTPIEWAQEVEVCVADLVPSESCVVPGAQGSYFFSGLETGVKLEFIPTYRSRLLTQYYDHKSTLAEATPISVPEKGVRENIDADLIEGGAIKGTVVAETTDEPLPEVEVCAVSVSGPTFKSCDETMPNGEYELHSLPTGLYRVGFWGRGESAKYQPWYYQNTSSIAQATLVSVKASKITSAVDVTLSEGAKIVGAVTAAASDLPLEGIAVCLFTVTGSAAQRCTESQAGGVYSFEGLPDGSFQIGFSLGNAEINGTGTVTETGGFVPQFFAGATTRVSASTISLLAPQHAEGVDAALVSSSIAPPPRIPAPPAAPFVAAPTIAPSALSKKDCKKGLRRKRIKGRWRCVAAAGHKSHHHRKRSKVKGKQR